MARRRLIRWGLALLLPVALASYALYLVTLAGQFKSLEPHFDGECTRVEGVVGAEDFVLAPDGHTVVMSSDDRRASWRGDSPERMGGIYTYDLDAQGPPKLVTKDLSSIGSFHPHGLDLVTDAHGHTTLYVVNHPHPHGSIHTIEVFDWNNGAPIHRSSFTDPLIHNPNDVVGLDGERFYVTNDHGPGGVVQHKIEEYGRLKRANVVYRDKGGVRIVAEGIRYANGINIDPDGSRVFVAATTDRAMLVFDRDPATGALSGRRDVFLGTGADNITIDEDGALWIAAQAKMLSFVAYSKDERKISPSQVLRLTPREDGEFTIDEVYLGEGDRVSASSGALRRGSRLVIGTVMDPHFLDCTLAAAG